MAIADIVQLFLPFLFCGDEISDILYLIFNWETFANIYFRNASLAFVLLNAIANFLSAIVVAFHLKGLQKPDRMKIVALICFCGWVPILSLVYILLYFKFIDLALKWNKADPLFENLKLIRKISHGLHYC
jgi:hypothetical protein